MNLKNIGILITAVFLTGCAGEVQPLGIETGKLLQCPTTPNCVSSQAIDNEHFIEPITVNKTQQQTKEQLIKILKNIENAQITEITNNYIRAEFASTVFNFVDDVEFYFPDTHSKNVIIHVRSASRVGYSDFGVNRKRIEEIRTQL